MPGAKTSRAPIPMSHSDRSTRFAYGSGEALLAGLDLSTLGYACTEAVPGAKAMHYVITRS
jgi:hypothetical protein